MFATRQYSQKQTESRGYSITLQRQRRSQSGSRRVPSWGSVVLSSAFSWPAWWSGSSSTRPPQPSSTCITRGSIPGQSLHSPSFPHTPAQDQGKVETNEDESPLLQQGNFNSLLNGLLVSVAYENFTSLANNIFSSY